MKKKLTDLETLIMGIVWDAGGQVTVRYVYENQRQRKRAYTTVMTVMGRMVDKQILDRDKSGRAYLYSPLVVKNSMLDIALKSLADQYVGGAVPSLVTYLLEGLNAAELAAVEQQIKELRKPRAAASA